MPASVVHRLEVIQIHEHQRVLTVLTARAIDELVQPAVEFSPVNQTGQCLVTRLPLKLARGCAYLADVVEHHDHAVRAARFFAYRGAGIADRTLSSVPVGEQH